MVLDLNKDESFKKAYDYGVYLLSLHLRTEGELKNKLTLKKFKLEITNAVIELLRENNYINDQRYAEVYLENLKKYKNFGYYGIKKKFMERRLSKDVIDEVLSAGLSSEEELKMAKRFLNKNQKNDLNKQARQLASRGFRSEVISQVLGNF